jgi:hypothetical protein
MYVRGIGDGLIRVLEVRGGLPFFNADCQPFVAKDP